MAFRHTALLMLDEHGNVADRFEDACLATSDTSPNANRTWAQKFANHYRCNIASYWKDDAVNGRWLEPRYVVGPNRDADA